MKNEKLKSLISMKAFLKC
ncbi:UNVERIFIED_CONTAM: hypothetical protein H355_002208 [Colinus virginianus]|nr:hypothetical protein H355_002208 [Colinus virginianus]